MHPTLRTAIGGILDGMQLHISFEQEEHRREKVQEFRSSGESLFPFHTLRVTLPLPVVGLVTSVFSGFKPSLSFC
jgi:hypothetical protein